jgi:CysZ protein
MPPARQESMFRMMNPIRDVVRGSRLYWLGVKWLRQRPIWLLLLFIPTLLGVGLMVGSLLLFWEYQTEIMRSLLFEPGEGWLWVLLYYISKGLLYLAALGLALLFGLLTSNVLAAPLYEWLSCAVEKEKYGDVTEITFWQTLKHVPEELKKVLLIMVLSILVFMVPGLNLLGIFVTASLVGWDYYDYPMARRGWNLRQRLKAAKKDYFAILGFGLWLVIPFVHFILMPMAVAGGTLMALERIDTIERR